MISEKLLWGVVAIFNSIPLLAGIIFQASLLFKDIDKIYKVTIGLLVLTAFAYLSAAIDSSVNQPAELSEHFINVYLMGFFILAFLSSEKIIIPVNGIISFLYTLTFWILVLPPENLSTLAVLFLFFPAFFVTVVSGILAFQKVSKYRNLFELVCYAWVSLFLVIFSFYIYDKEISTFFSNGFNLAGLDMPWLQLFFVGSIFFSASMTALSFLLMFPIFSGKRRHYSEEVERARLHREKISEIFENKIFTGKTLIIFLVVIALLLICKNIFALPNSYIVYIALSSSYLFVARESSLVFRGK